MRRAFVFAVVSFAALGAACVDLFHATDFETLCMRDPGHAKCSASEAGAPDAAEDAGEDASKPHPDFCAWSSAEAQSQAGRACAWLGACEGPLGGARFGECVITAQLAYDCRANPSLRPRGKLDELWGCLATVQSCADVDACIFPGGKPPCPAIASGKFTSCATGAGNETVRVECAAGSGEKISAAEPCLLTGRTCAMRAGSTSFADCARTIDSACKPGRTSCQGTTLVSCSTSPETPNVDRGFDCAFYGAGRCLSDGISATCIPGPEAPSCTTSAGITCDGSVARLCVATGGVTPKQEIAIDCARLGLPCDVTSVPPSASTPWAACAQWDTRGGTPVLACNEDDACNGSMLESCAAGVRKTYDCKSAGLGGCRTISGSGVAACTPPK
jgi:hypothetical protein